MKKDDTVVAGAEAEFGAGRLEFDHVAGAGRKIVIDGLEYSHRRFAVDCPQFGLRLRRPDDDLFVWD